MQSWLRLLLIHCTVRLVTGPSTMHDLGKATNRSLAISTSILDDAITLVGVVMASELHDMLAIV
jgi:hypothetical protein